MSDLGYSPELLGSPVFRKFLLLLPYPSTPAGPPSWGNGCRHTINYLPIPPKLRQRQASAGADTYDSSSVGLKRLLAKGTCLSRVMVPIEDSGVNN